MSKQFDGKVVIVTGATSGIGKNTAIAFGREGAKVVVAGRRADEGAETVRAVKAAGGQAIFVKTDVAKEADVEALVARTVETYGRLDFAFNNAGVFGDTGPLTQSTDEIYDYTFNINVRGIVYCMKHQIPAMLKNGGGSIVNNASALGLYAMTNAPLYNASKFAVVGLTKSAALDVATQGIRINAVCPAVIETDINAGMRDNPDMHSYMLAKHPIGRFGKEEEVSAAVLFLCSPGAGFMTGVALPIDGGWTAQ